MKYLPLFLFFFLCSLTTFAQDTEQSILDRFFELYGEDTDQAIDFLYSSNPWIEGQGDAITQLKSQITYNQSLMGAFIEAELLHKSQLGESFNAYVYLVKHERQPLRFLFTFYQPKDKVMVFSFEFDGNIVNDFKEYLKYEYLNTY